VRTYVVTLEELGLQRAEMETILGGSAEENAATMTALLQGKAKGPKRDLLLLNAGAALMAAGLAEDIREGMALAEKAMDSGAAWDRLEALRKMVPREGS
jgi:anthranilate phosphoribosyltransferase